MESLWGAHFDEVAMDREEVPLCPDIAAYEAMASDGRLHLVVGRAAGQIVAYHITLVRPGLHNVTTLCGYTDVYYCAPDRRTGRTPVRMFQFVEKTLSARGVKKLFTGTKLSLDAGRLFEFMGWRPTETLYTKVLGG